MNRFSITVEPELKNVLRQRADFNKRSLNGEIVYLLECALAAEIEGNQAILRTLMLAQGGPTPNQMVEEDSHTAHTATV